MDFHEIAKKIHDRITLRGKTGASKTELMALLNVSERTLKSYLTKMRDEFYAPIQYSKYHKGYSYTKEFKLVQDIGFSVDDRSNLVLAKEFLKPLEHIKIFGDAKNILDKFIQKTRASSDKGNLGQFIQFDIMASYKNIHLVGTLLTAMQDEFQVEFDYHSYKNAAALRHRVEPHFIRQYNQRWYLIAWLVQEQAFGVFALDRIVSDIYTTTKSFKRRNFDIQEYYRNNYGVYIDHTDSVEKVVLLFSPSQAPYFKSKPFFEPYEATETPDGLVVSIDVRINHELVRKLLSFGSDVKILQPISLQNKVKSMLKKMLALYELPIEVSH